MGWRHGGILAGRGCRLHERSESSPACPAVIPVVCSDPCFRHRALMPERPRGITVLPCSFFSLILPARNVPSSSANAKRICISSSELSASRAPKYRAAKPRNGWDRRGLRLEYSLASAASWPATGAAKWGGCPSENISASTATNTTDAENPDKTDCLIRDGQIFFVFRQGRLITERHRAGR